MHQTSKLFSSVLTALCFISALICVDIDPASARIRTETSGGEHSGGGGYREAQFKGLGYAIVDILKDAENLPHELARVDLKKLKKVIDLTTVECTDEILRPSPDGKILPALLKDALNTPIRKKIRFNFDSWDLIPNGSARAALVLHEYLGILFFMHVPYTDDREYQISHLLNDFSALRLWFDNLEIAQSMTENVRLDFPLECDYRISGSETVRIGTLGTRKLAGGGEEHTPLMARTVSVNEKTDEKLQIYVYDESDEDLAYFGGVMRPDGPRKASVRIVVGYARSVGTFPKTLLFSQSIAIAPNLKFTFDLAALDLTVECHRVRITGLVKPSEWE
ncbi:MAG: hypothetical protein H7301_08670 [Cryobacterium sp.]|nr:hypothetical protein [Oligoflexia bacterium]